ncbi:MAG: glycerol-3-phosphate 1-O-acyltransferase PlsY [Lacunisphaera sp.]|nr:glycerol-3-phosphate 1-O-acyltransferase PlsY [Lacunisphaera sp.]
MIWYLVIAAAAGYILGSLPFGYLVARAHGVDIFKVGSGNPGATNVKRVLGAKAGGMVLGLDAFKGALAAAWSLFSYTSLSVTVDLEAGGGADAISGQDWRLVGLAGLIGSVVGHSFSVFTKFKGGKGVATAAGGVLVLMPVSCLVAGAVWLVTFYTTRYVSLGSILAAAALAVATWVRGNPLPLNIVVTLLALFVIARHRENITRLLNGTENKFVKQPKA